MLLIRTPPSWPTGHRTHVTKMTQFRPCHPYPEQDLEPLKSFSPHTHLPFITANVHLFFETEAPHNVQQTFFQAKIRNSIEMLPEAPPRQEFAHALILELPPLQLFSPLVLRDTVFYRRLLEYLDPLGVKTADRQAGKRKLYAHRLTDTI